jgi:hypothetical protein
MRQIFPKTGCTHAARALLASTVLLALYGCSGYFTPWSAFQPAEYDLGPSTLVPDSPLLAVPDSVDRGAGVAPVVWYSFAAFRDTTYVLTLYPKFGRATLGLFDTATQSSVISVKATIPSAVGVTMVWACKKDGTYYLRIGSDSVTFDGTVPFPGSFSLSLKSFEDAYGSIADAYEPDSTQNLAARISFTSGNAAEKFQYHRIAPKDTDWFVFSPDYAHVYEIRTVGNEDTRISLMAQGKDSIEVSDDNSGGGKNAKLSWTCPYSSGAYTRYFFVTGQTRGVYGISITDRGF